MTMRKFFKTILAGMLLLPGLAVLSQDASVYMTETAPVIDGVADDALWANADPHYCDSNVGNKAINGSSAFWKAAWDATNLYILVDVSDDILWDNSGAPSWNTDNLEIYFQMENDRNGEGPQESHGTQYAYQWNNDEMGMSGAGTTDGVVWTRVDKGVGVDGYIIEMSIPWASLEADFVADAGAMIAFDVNVVDNDGLGTYSTMYWLSTSALWGNIDGAGTIMLQTLPDAFVMETLAAPVVDGVADEALWEGIDANNCGDHGFWKAAWDADNFYLLVDVVDDILFDNGSPNWNTDNLEIYFQMQNERNGTGPSTSHGTQLSFRWNEGIARIGGAGTSDNIEFTSIDKGVGVDGYVIEVKVPWASLDETFVVGGSAQIAFDVNIVDSDAAGAYTTAYWVSTSGLWGNIDGAGTIGFEMSPFAPLQEVIDGATAVIGEIPSLPNRVATLQAAIDQAKAVVDAGTATIEDIRAEIATLQDAANAFMDNITGEYSGIEYFGDAMNFTEVQTDLWDVIDDNGEMVYAIYQEKPYGGNRKSIVNDLTLSHDYFVTADVKLFKRPSGTANMAKYEDAILFFAYQDEDNHAGAWFMNHHMSVGDSWDPFGVSGFEIKFEGETYRLKKFDDPGDPVEEIDPETCIPYNDDTSFDEWNNIRMEKHGSIISMIVNGGVYYAIDFDTLTVVNVKGTSEYTPVPDGFVDFVLGSGQVGIGSGNDKVYFDNVDAGLFYIAGQFADDAVLGEAGNYTEINPWLWDVIEEDGDMRYGIVAEKPAGGNRKSILDDYTHADNFFVSTDIKLFKRPSGTANMAKYEDAIIFFAYQDEDNHAGAWYMNHHMSVGDSWDPFGVSGFEVKYEGVTYRFKKLDDPGDPVEEIDPETCIPYNDDTSFDEWNNIELQRIGSVVSMIVNGGVYYEIDFDTVTVVNVKGTTELTPVPDGLVDFILSNGQIGIGSGNDKVYFDNIEAGEIILNVVGEFSDIPYYGEAGNYTELQYDLWGVIDDNGEMAYAIVQDKPYGGNRKSIVDDVTLGHDFFVKSDVKLYKRPSGVANTAWWEDAILFFLYQDEDNYAQAEFFNTHGPADGELSGFTVKVGGESYVIKKADEPENTVEEIPEETCIPYVDDTSFEEWNTIEVRREGSMLSMVVNGATYFSIDIAALDIDQAAIDFLNGSGQVGIGSGNDRVSFDNINAGYIGVEGQFSDIEFFGEAGNYTEINPWLWDVIEEDGDTRYGIVAEKPAGGTRRSIVNDVVLDRDFYVSADVKLFKRPSGTADMAKYEDAILYFDYKDEQNYVSAWFMNHHMSVGDAWDPYGVSGFEVRFEGVDYRLKKLDDPGDPVEEVPAETCIPYVDDSSFNDWNTITVKREGSVVSMIVNNDRVYYSIDFDTVTVLNLKGTADMVPVPDGLVDFVLGSGQVGIGSGNDKVYFDNVEAGYIGVEGQFSDIEGYGEAGNYTEVNPWLWGVIEEDGDTRYGIVEDKPAGGDRKSIYNDATFDGDFYIESDVKLFKRPSGAAGSAWWEDATLIFNYVDAKNYCYAEFFNTHGPETGSGNDAFGLSGFNIIVDGVRYQLKHGDDPGDEVEEIPEQTCIPYVDDSSFDAWNKIKVQREGSILAMFVNDVEYFQIDVDAITEVEKRGDAAYTPITDEIKAVLTGGGKVGVGSGNDKVYFDNIKAGIPGVIVEEVDFVIDANAMILSTEFDPATGSIELFTSIDDFATAIIPTDDDEDGNYTTSITNVELGEIQYKIVVDGVERVETTVYIVIEGDNTVNAILTTGVEGIESTSVQMYPNPVTDKLQINSDTEIMSIEIFSIYGQRVMTLDVASNMNVVDLSELSDGIYIVNLRMYNGEQVTNRIIKQ